VIRLAIVEDHTLVRQALRTLLEQRPDIQVIGEYSDGKQTLAQIPQLQPDVLLLDLLLPDMDGVEIIQQIKKFELPTRIIVLTSHYNDIHILQAVKAGADSCLFKDSSPQELIETISSVAQGKSSIPATVSSRILRAISGQEKSPLNALTPREREVLICLAHGYSNRKIATELVISEPTVRTHITSILTKLQLADRTQAALFALQQGLVRIEDVLGFLD